MKITNAALQVKECKLYEKSKIDRFVTTLYPGLKSYYQMVVEIGGREYICTFPKEAWPKDSHD